MLEQEVAEEVEDMDDLVKVAKKDGYQDDIIDADTKMKIQNPKKMSRHEIFNEMKEVDRYFSQGFTHFLIVYKPVTLNDLYDKLDSFSKIQDS